ncbi:MAG TPA: hypothetical protein PLN53_09070 [Terricaulis sp.]|nr:hypothetical protein [Terricaulis sp.]
MPMVNDLALNMNAAFSNTASLAATAATHAPAYAPGQLPLSPNLVYPTDPVKRAHLGAYLNIMPRCVQETIRATIYYALTHNPPLPLVFSWGSSVSFSARVSQLPNAVDGEGLIYLAVSGPFPSDVPRVYFEHAYVSPMGAASKLSSKGAPRPAKRRPSSRSKKSSGRA